MKNKIIPILIAIAILAVGLSIVKSINPKKPEQPKQKPYTGCKSFRVKISRNPNNLYNKCNITSENISNFKAAS